MLAICKVRLNWRSILAAALCVLVVAGCAVSRLSPVPDMDATRALPLGLTNARFFPLRQRELFIAEWTHALERQRNALGLPPDAALPAARFLAISGGGDEGAFGAGLLVGWTDAGTRPEFQVVTGISTGALIAPFAFLGPEFDRELREVYTTITSDDILSTRGVIEGVLRDALTDTTALWRLISRYVNEQMMASIAREYAKGRLLLIGTTDLDAQRANIWNIGAIAASGYPDALDLIRKILRASSAIPGLFQPVLIDVDLDGKTYQELHVDGGAISQIFLYPPSIDITSVARRERSAYLIRNARENPQWTNVRPRTLSITGRAIATMLLASGSNDLARIYFVTQRDQIDYNLAYINEDFLLKRPETAFDKEYMNALFEYGYKQARSGYRWFKVPPILAGAISAEDVSK